ncbi:phosphotransferase [Actinokineospora sp. NPDC004072]
MRWIEAPSVVHALVADRTRALGHDATAVAAAVETAQDVAAGSASDLAAVLTLAGRPLLFVKAVRGVSRRMRWLRNEVSGNAAAVGVAPRVLFHADIADGEDDWLVVGFDHVPGRRASLAPGSPDLAVVGAVVERIAALPAGGLRPLRQRWAPVDWWERIADSDPDLVTGFDVAEMTRLSQRVPELVDGDRLLHTDLHGEQIIVSPDGQGAKVVDWGFPGAGAPWVDTAFLVLRLIEAGHPAGDAERWARQRPAFAALDDATLTAWAAYVAGLWSHIATAGGAGSPRRARLARDYAAYRLAQARRTAARSTG